MICFIFIVFGTYSNVVAIGTAQILKQDNGPSSPPNMSPWDFKWWSRGMLPETKPDGEDHWLKRQVNYEPNFDPDAVKVATKQAELQSLLQQIYQAEAAVKMETGEVTRTQEVALEAEQALEEATNKVRMLSADLQSAQEAAAQAAMRAHTAQLQLSAHDQLMFTARQRVDALSAQMVSVQADLASAQQLYALNNSSQRLEQQAHAFQTQPEDSVLTMPSDSINYQLPNQDVLQFQSKYPWSGQFASSNLGDTPKHVNAPFGFQ